MCVSSSEALRPSTRPPVAVRFSELGFISHPRRCRTGASGFAS